MDLYSNDYLMAKMGEIFCRVLQGMYGVHREEERKRETEDTPPKRMQKGNIQRAKSWGRRQAHKRRELA